MTPEFDPALNKERWVAYFDLLGIRSLVAKSNLVDVFNAYADAVEQARQKDFPGEVSRIWFSDTFVFYTADNSASSFAVIESVSRWFCHSLVVRQVPVRGAISSGLLYADPAHDLFFGAGLIDAYEYGECQNWIGMVLTPAAVKRLREVDLPADQRLNYVYWSVPQKASSPQPASNLSACLFAGPTDSPVRERCIAALEAMKSAAPSYATAKYQNTLTFLDHNIRLPLPRTHNASDNLR